MDEDDEVIIPTPYWVTYSELVKIARGKVVEIQTSGSDGFKITPEQLEAAITPKLKCSYFLLPAIQPVLFTAKRNWKALQKFSESIRTLLLFLMKYMSTSIL